MENPVALRSVGYAGRGGALLALAFLAIGCGQQDHKWGYDHLLPTAEVVTYCVGLEVDEWWLRDSEGTTHSIPAYRGRVVVVEFWSTRCLYVRRSEKARRRFVADYTPRGVVYLAVASNSDEYPEEIRGYLAERQSSYTVLVDYESHGAVRFAATRTPQTFVIDREGVVRFAGCPVNPEQWARGEPERLNWLEAAVDALLAGRMPNPATRTAFGSKIRWGRTPIPH